MSSVKVRVNPIPEPDFLGKFFDERIIANPPEKLRYVPIRSKSLIKSTAFHLDEPYKFEALKTGDVIRRVFYEGYQSGFVIEVLRNNNKSIKGIEIRGSFHPGTTWHIPKTTMGTYLLAYEYMPHERLNEIFKKWKERR